MKKCRNLNQIEIKNPVAKHARQFNKAQIFVDKSKYRRKAKHPKQEAFSIDHRDSLKMPPAWNLPGMLLLLPAQ
ncbi:MAG: DUF7230 family protein [Gammaproteobacteria bacterium]